MQAGAMGLPSVVTNINGSNEIVVDNKNGIIISPKSISNLKNAMLRILNDSHLKNQLSINARPMIVSRFSQNYIWNEILNEYNYFLKNVN
jgi:glycosyltransferase involved in cell wall biosynthesis